MYQILHPWNFKMLQNSSFSNWNLDFAPKKGPNFFGRLRRPRCFSCVRGIWENPNSYPRDILKTPKSYVRKRTRGGKKTLTPKMLSTLRHDMGIDLCWGVKTWPLNTWGFWRGDDSTFDLELFVSGWLLGADCGEQVTEVLDTQKVKHQVTVAWTVTACWVSQWQSVLTNLVTVWRGGCVFFF